MDMENPKQYTPEEIVKLEKSRARTETKLIRKGAEYVVDENGRRMLNVSDEQILEIKGEKKAEEELQSLEKELAPYKTKIQKLEELKQKVRDIRVENGKLLLIDAMREIGQAIQQKPGDKEQQKIIFSKLESLIKEQDKIFGFYNFSNYGRHFDENELDLLRSEASKRLYEILQKWGNKEIYPYLGEDKNGKLILVPLDSYTRKTEAQKGTIGILRSILKQDCFQIIDAKQKQPIKSSGCVECNADLRQKFELKNWKSKVVVKRSDY